VKHERTGRPYDNRQRERAARFIREQIQVLAGVMSAGRYAHLILAGTARATALVRKGLSKTLAARMVDSVPASASDRVSDIITSTLACFLQHEETESQAISDRLVTQIYTNGLAVAGAGPTLQALKSRQADFLVIAKNYEPTSGWECRNCGRMDLSSPDPNFCPDCRNRSVRQFDIRAEMVRLAKQQLCGVEVVEHSDALLRVGGVGCLLRFLSPERYASQAA
jgi:peptide subunit release factor 1 (eRF1)